MENELAEGLVGFVAASKDGNVLRTLANSLTRELDCLDSATLGLDKDKAVRLPDSIDAVVKAYNLVNQAKLILEREAAKLDLSCAEFELNRSEAEK